MVLPVPDFFDEEKAGKVWKVPYQERESDAEKFASENNVKPSSEDSGKIALLLVDVQNTFCLPDFELYVAGRSGTGAVDDNKRLCRFIYKNLDRITKIYATLDTHFSFQVFHSQFLVDGKGNHPKPLTQVTTKDVKSGKWKFNDEIAPTLGISAEEGQRWLEHYVKSLEESGKFDMTIWPYHAMLGGIGHAMVSSVEEACFFHSIARKSQVSFEIKGRNSLTEHYSAIGPEVLKKPDGSKIAEKNKAFVDELLSYDAVVIAGQAKSHCVAWTVQDLLSHIRSKDAGLAKKVYLLEDCTSPVVVPDAVDFTGSSDEAFKKFAEAGMHLVKSTDSMKGWAGMDKALS